MADKYEGSFVSKTVLDGDRNARRSYLEQELERARSKFESEKKLKELKEQRGETTWMLPSLSRKIKEDHQKVSKKKKKKKEKKSKKHKKEKRRKKQEKAEKEDFSGSSDASSDEDWVEKCEQKVYESTGMQKTTTKDILMPEEKVDESLLESTTSSKREDWMLSSSFLDVVAKESESIAEKRARRKEERMEFKKPLTYEPGQHPNELNPYWKDGGKGTPTMPSSHRGKDTSQVGSNLGNAGSSWVKKAYQRAIEQAEEQGRSLEEVVSERWGSMKKLNALLQAGEKRQRGDNERGRRGWRRDNHCTTQNRDSRKIDEERCFDNSEAKAIKSKTESPALAKDGEGKNASKRLQSGNPNDDDAVLDDTKPIMQRGPRAPNDDDAASAKWTGSRNQSSSESDSEISASSDEEEEQNNVKPLSEKDINEISAKILRAELMGNQELVDQLKAKLEAGKARAPNKRSPSKESNKKQLSEEDEVVLTRTDKHGNVYPLKVSGEDPAPRKKRRKTKKIETHDAKGNRIRYFQEDDGTDLKSMVEEERLTTADDHQHAVMSRLSRKAGNPMGDYYTLDDMFENSSASKESRGEKDERAKKRAIAEHQKSMLQQANCRFCFDNPEIAKHLIISIASHVYLALPITSSLTEGHCLIIPMQHISASTYLDENVMQEITMFKSVLTKMFREKDEDVIFLEIVKNLKRPHHMLIECIPVPKEVGDVAPIYFKKAIQESESEWAQNKKVVEIKRNKGIRAAIPKGLPYFAVEFGLDGGFAHVIEDEVSFQHYFGKEIIGNILDLEPVNWRKPPKESFQLHKRKVLNFSENWEAFDWTRDL